METQSQTDDFIPYPTHRVVGTIVDAKEDRSAIEALLAAGLEQDDIDVLHGEKDLHRLDPTGADHGVLAQFQRTLMRTAGPAEEFKHLSHHVDDVRAGRFVIMVLAKEREKRYVAADILKRTARSLSVSMADGRGSRCRQRPLTLRNAARATNSQRTTRHRTRIWRPTRRPSPPSMT